MNIRNTIIWDWNGTLLNDAYLALDILNSMLTKRGLTPLTFDYYQSIYGHPIEGIYEKAGFILTDEPFEKLCHEWFDSYCQGLKEAELHHDALSTLEQLQNNNYTQTILSALAHDTLSESIEHHGIGKFFTDIIGLQDRFGRSKLDNAKLLMEKLDAKPRSTIIIGDTCHDAEVAQFLGIDCVLVSRGYESREKLEQSGYTVCRDLGEVLERI